jgi:hypothetical protein
MVIIVSEGRKSIHAARSGSHFAKWRTAVGLRRGVAESEAYLITLQSRSDDQANWVTQPFLERVYRASDYFIKVIPQKLCQHASSS